MVQAAVADALSHWFETHPKEAKSHRPEGDGRRRGARGGAQGARTDAAQGRARCLHPARQARRLPGARSGEIAKSSSSRAIQRRRLGQAGARPQVPGDPAAERQDPERRARALRPHAGQRRDRHADHRARHRHRPRRAGAGRLRRRQAALPPHRHHDRRRCGRLAYPHAAADLLLPPDAGADRARASVHRPAAAVPRQARQRRALPEGRPRRWRSSCSTRRWPTHA